jgi:hypothetical protein
MKTNIFISFILLLILGTASAQAAVNPRWERTISHSPVLIRAGQYVTFYATVEALQGPVRYLEITGGVDNVQVLNKTITKLERNEKMVVSFRWKSTVGNHTAYLQIDPQNRIGDINRDDNLIQLPFKVAELDKAASKMGAAKKPRKSTQAKIGPAAGAALPDITIIGMNVYNPDNPSAKSDEFREGDPITVEVTVKNIGQRPTGPFWVQLAVKAHEAHAPKPKFTYEEQSTKSLEPGKIRKILFNLGHQHSPAQAIFYEFTATVDYNERVGEFDEDNNSMMKPAERKSQ